MPQSSKPSRSQSELTQLLTGPRMRSAAGKIARAICARGSITASDIAQYTGLARSTISTALTELRRSGVVVEIDMDSDARKDVGRPVKVITLNPDAGTTLGIHLSLMEVNLAVVDVAHNVICKHTVELVRDYDPKEAAEKAYKAARDLYEKHQLNFAGLLGVGISASGPVSPAGQILHSSILPKWAGHNVRDTFEPVFQRPVSVENESNCAALAEMTWGAAQGIQNFMVMKIDLGVGGAFVQNGQVLKGITGGAGEFGHMCVVPNGDICRCGNRGCLETIASFNRPLEELSQLNGRNISIEESIVMAQAGDRTSRRLIEETAENAGWGLSMISTALNPSLILIGGHMALAGDLLMEPLIKAYERHVMIKPHELPENQRTRIIIGRFTEDDSLRGAAGLVLHSIGEVLENHSQ